MNYSVYGGIRFYFNYEYYSCTSFKTKFQRDKQIADFYKKFGKLDEKYSSAYYVIRLDVDIDGELKIKKWQKR